MYNINNKECIAEYMDHLGEMLYTGMHNYMCDQLPVRIIPKRETSPIPIGNDSSSI